MDGSRIYILITTAPHTPTYNNAQQILVLNQQLTVIVSSLDSSTAPSVYSISKSIDIFASFCLNDLYTNNGAHETL